MSIRAVAWVSDEVDDISPTERAVLYFLADKARDHSGTQQAWPSTVFMADRLGMNRSTVQRSIKKLRDSGLIVRGDQSLVARRGGGRRPVVWALNVPSKPQGE
ncbi:helix-turn-helix domain-containing protein [Corynebacterium pseudopelargi]|uniref:MarR family protein n=1 Tax=Corynebacterium pseudopelargi TaxID=2080757 RepID=A0A3G6IT29_9CORY|nr:helix-turn-helix domain-containing protein [Corynebacterium pseudopelargi]AZA08726.1 MarR family protein [Corynebacterium pseudopelargi]